MTKDQREDFWNKEGAILKMGDSNNDWNYDFRLMFSIGDQQTMMYPAEFDRIGTLSIDWWKWGMNPKEPEKMVQMA